MDRLSVDNLADVADAAAGLAVTPRRGLRRNTAAGDLHQSLMDRTLESLAEVADAAGGAVGGASTPRTGGMRRHTATRDLHESFMNRTPNVEDLANVADAAAGLEATPGTRGMRRNTAVPDLHESFMDRTMEGFADAADAATGGAATTPGRVGMRRQAGTRGLLDQVSSPSAAALSMEDFAGVFETATTPGRVGMRRQAGTRGLLDRMSSPSPSAARSMEDLADIVDESLLGAVGGAPITPRGMKRSAGRTLLDRNSSPAGMGPGIPMTRDLTTGLGGAAWAEDFMKSLNITPEKSPKRTGFRGKIAKAKGVFTPSNTLLQREREVLAASAGAGLNTMTPVEADITLETSFSEEDRLKLPGRRREPLEEDYELLNSIQKGGFSEVWEAFSKKENRKIAAKKIKLDEGGPMWRNVQKVQREVMITNRVYPHDNIIKLHASFRYENRVVFLMMELCMTSLKTYLYKMHGDLTPGQIRGAARDMLRAIEHIHNMRILHRDMKPENVLVTIEGKIKITDFGLSRYHDQPEPGRRRHHTIVGTLNYMPPEMLMNDRNYTYVADIWGVGCTIGDLYQVKPLVGTSKYEMLECIQNLCGSIPNLPDTIEDIDDVFPGSLLPPGLPNRVMEFFTRFTGGDRDAAELFDAIFTIAQGMRISAKDALQKKYFQRGPALEYLPIPKEGWPPRSPPSPPPPATI